MLYVGIVQGDYESQNIYSLGLVLGMMARLYNSVVGSYEACEHVSESVVHIHQ